MKYIKKYEDTDSDNWKIIEEINNILDKCIDLSFDNGKTEAYKKYIKVQRNSYNSFYISLSTLYNSFEIKIDFIDKSNNSSDLLDLPPSGDCKIDEQFDCSKKLEMNINKILNSFLNEISIIKGYGYWIFNKSDFIKKLPDLDIIIDKEKYNL